MQSHSQKVYSNKEIREIIKKMYTSTKWEKFYFNVKWRKGSAIEFFESLVPNEGLIIDIGCGTGILANFLTLKSNRRKIIGTDLDERRIESAKKTIMGKNIEFCVKDIGDLKINDCDAITIYDVIHHINPEMQLSLLKQCYSKLKKGGVLLIKDVDKKPILKYAFVRTLDQLTNVMHTTLGKLNFVKSKKMTEILKSIGFEVEVIKPPIKDFCPHIIYSCKKN